MSPFQAVGPVRIALNRARSVLSKAKRRFTAGLNPFSMLSRIQLAKETSDLTLRCDCGLDHSLESTEPTRREKPIHVCFTWGAHAGTWGSTLMRSKQLSTMLRNFDSGLVVTATTVEKMRKTGETPNVLVMHKSVRRLPHIETFLTQLRADGVKIVLDLVDGDPFEWEPLSSFIDFYICASRSENRYRVARGERSAFIAHHVDLRILPYQRSHNAFKLGFSGLPKNALFIEALPVATFDSSGTVMGRKFKVFIEFLRSLSHHYSVRHYDKHFAFKPGLKIYIAAQLGAVFVGSKADEESYLVLGDSYPYLSAESTLESVEQCVEYAESTFNTDAHVKALARMKEIQPEFCPAAVTASLHSVLMALLGSGSR